MADHGGSQLLQLPRELRDEIYRYYLKEDDGYAYVPHTGRLRCADGRHIDLSLVYTCKMIAAEMRTLPLKVNTVNFHTTVDQEERSPSDDQWTNWSRAGRYDFLLDRLNFIREEAFAVAASMFANTQTVEQVNQCYPGTAIGHLLEYLLEIQNTTYVPMLAITSSPSTMGYSERCALLYSLRLLSAGPAFMEHLKIRSFALYILGYLPAWDTPVSASTGYSYLNSKRIQGARARVGWNPSNDAPKHAGELSSERMQEITSAIITMEWRPWEVPSESELLKMRNIFESSDLSLWQGYDRALPELRYYVSAASQAVRFMGSLPLVHRAEMRHVTLSEDKKSVAMPECHMQGLLPYMNELPNLRLERNVHMLRAVFPDQNLSLARLTRDSAISSWTRCPVSQAVFHMSAWLIEAVSIETNLLSISIHFEAPEITAERVWSKVKSIAAFYDAVVRCVQDEKPPYRTTKDAIGAFVDERGTHVDPYVLPRSLRRVLSGLTAVRMSCSMGTISEFEEECSQVALLLDGQPHEAWEEHRLKILQGYLGEGYGGVEDFDDVLSIYADRPES